MNDCRSCANSYGDNNGVLRCRINGLMASKENADDCRQYEREPGSDDEIAQDRSWCCDKPGRGD